MKHLLYILLFLMSAKLYAQYTLDDSIKTHPFLKRIAFGSDPCGLNNSYYEPETTYGMNGAGMACYLLQEQIKDSLRARFSNKALFEIARFSKIRFYRIAAFELYSQTDYSHDEVIHFLKRGKIPSWLSDNRGSDTIPETYLPMTNAFLPASTSIRFKMLDIIDPTATRSMQTDSLLGYVMINMPKYPKSKPLDLETFVSVKAYLSYYCRENVTAWAWTKASTFYLPYPSLDFGTIDLDYADANDRYFELRGAIKVINLSSKTISIYGQASAHTVCTNSNYVIEPKQEMMLEFKSLVDLLHPFINRTITLTNRETGESQVFNFKASFIHLKK